MNLGLGEESTAKIKLRMGLNLKSYKVRVLSLAVMLCTRYPPFHYLMVQISSVLSCYS
jgi:hypothetical protein